jgi:hypothetical protein
MIGQGRLADRAARAFAGNGDGVANGPFRSVPPGTDNIWVPVWSRRAALAGLSLHASCRPSIIGVHHAVWGVVALAGPRAIPGPAIPWLPPMPEAVWLAIGEQWAAALEPFDGVAIYERPQAQRSGFGVLLLCHDRPLAFVKVLRGAGRAETTWAALQALTADPVPGCHVPRPLARGEHDGWTWMATSAIPGFPHRPAHRPPITRISAGICARLRPVFDPSGVPAHWEPMHGDLAPWNLRRVGPRSLWLLDWDDAGWGPPGADAVYYEATSSVVRRRRPVPGSAPNETLRFWAERVERRLNSGIDRTYNIALLAQLSGMR